jgi:hypothetical protein
MTLYQKRCRIYRHPDFQYAANPGDGRGIRYVILGVPYSFREAWEYVNAN